MMHVYYSDLGIDCLAAVLLTLKPGFHMVVNVS